MKKLVLALFTASLLAACSAPKIDGSNEEAFKQSLQKISASLSPDEKQKFQAAYLVLAGEFVRNEMGKLFAAAFSGQDISHMASPEQAFFAQLNGKDYRQITEEADAVMLAQINAEKETLTKTIGRLKKEQALSRQSRKMLADIKISNAEFYSKLSESARRLGWTADTFKEHVVQFDIYNGTPEAISFIVLNGKITLPERTIPFFEGTLTASFPGGIEPKEKQHFKGKLNSWSEWAKAQNPQGSVLSLEVTEAYGAKDRLLWKNSFSSKQEEELAQAEAKLTQLTQSGRDWYAAYAQELQNWQADLPPWAQLK